MEKEIKVLVVTQRRIELDLPDIYVPIQSGAALSKFDLGYLRDDSGINISEKNGLYADLTPQYWAWKNLECDIIGINHYRRYFTKIPKLLTLLFKFKSNIILSGSEIHKAFEQGYDCILPYEMNFGKETVKEQFIRNLDSKNSEKIIIDFLENVKNSFPDDFIYINNLMNSHHAYMRGIFIMKKVEFDEYMMWLFRILDGFAKTNDYDVYRLYAFLGERLIGAFIEKKQYKVKKYHIFNTEGELKIWMVKYHLTKFLKKQ